MSLSVIQVCQIFPFFGSFFRIFLGKLRKFACEKFEKKSSKNKKIVSNSNVRIDS